MGPPPFINGVISFNNPYKWSYKWVSGVIILLIRSYINPVYNCLGLTFGSTTYSFQWHRAGKKCFSFVNSWPHLTLPETNMAPENNPLEVWSFLLETIIFRCYVSFRECTSELLEKNSFPVLTFVSFLGVLSDLFRGCVTFIWVIKRSLGRSWWLIFEDLPLSFITLPLELLEKYGLEMIQNKKCDEHQAFFQMGLF